MGWDHGSLVGVDQVDGTLTGKDCVNGGLVGMDQVYRWYLGKIES